MISFNRLIYFILSVWITGYNLLLIADGWTHNAGQLHPIAVVLVHSFPSLLLKPVQHFSAIPLHLVHVVPSLVAECYVIM